MGGEGCGAAAAAPAVAVAREPNIKLVALDYWFALGHRSQAAVRNCWLQSAGPDRPGLEHDLYHA